MTAKNTAAESDRQKQIETAYNRGLSLEKSGRFTEAAAAYAQVLALDKDDCAGVAVRLAAMGLGAAPKAAPKAYITTLFDQYADVFDMILVDKLSYNVPNLLHDEIAARYPGRTFNRLLDLGCGTGLAGEAFEDLAAHKTGLDLSENMIEIAHEREIYDRLFVGEIAQFLQSQNGQEKWDIIIAADVLPYMGELEEFFKLISAVLEKGGIFAFSDENMDKIERNKAVPQAENAAESDREAEREGGFMVGPHQRFAHKAAYIEECLRKAGLEAEYCADITVRQEQNAPVPGQIYLTVKI